MNFLQSNCLQATLQIPTHPKINPLFPKTSKIITLDPRQASDSRSNPNVTRIKRDRAHWGNHALKKNQTPRQYRKSLQKELKTQGNLSKLNYSFDIQKSSETKRDFSILSHLSSLPSLDLIYSDSSRDQVPSIKPLLHALPSLKNLSSLHLSFYLIRFKDRKILSGVVKCLRKLPKFTDLCLHFAFSTNLFPKQIDFLSVSLSKLTQLRDLKLNFEGSFRLQAQDVDKLSIAFSKLHNLSSISLEFGIYIYKSTLQNLFISLQGLQKTLTNISLSINGCAIARENNAEPLSGSLEYLDCSLLRRLSFAPYQAFNDESLILLARKLKESTCMTHLNLKFPHFSTSLTDEYFPELTSAISGIHSLTSLDLFFPYGMELKSAVFNIASALRSLENLENLKIVFLGNNETEDADFQQLFYNTRLCKSLKYLYISADGEKNLTDNSFEVLGKSLRELVLLKSLDLSFSAAHELSQKGKNFITSAIEGNKKLSENSNLGWI